MKTIFTLLITLSATLSLSAQTSTTIKNAGLVNTTNGSRVVISWTKGSENTNFYVVERSNNGTEFKQTAIVFASEDPQLVNYKFKDQDLSSDSGTVYYRIGIVNDKKEVTYLPVQEVSL